MTLLLQIKLIVVMFFDDQDQGSVILPPIKKTAFQRSCQIPIITKIGYGFYTVIIYP